jgi:hypothetical protein
VQGSRPQGGSMLGTDHGVNAAGLQDYSGGDVGGITWGGR